MSIKSLEVFAVGSTINLGGIDVQITAIMIRDAGKISYEIVWWDGRSRKCDWIESIELVSLPLTRMRIGFKSTDKTNG